MINRYYVISVLLLASFVLSIVLTPTEKISDTKAPVDLEKMIPEKFGDWELVPEVNVSQIGLSPVNNENVSDLIYEQTLMRTYMNKKNEKIMLAIAYGTQQKADLTVHRPEVCYVSQGFQIKSKSRYLITVDNRKIPVTRLIAKYNSRIEPVTYWVRIGDFLATNSVEMKWGVLKAGLFGNIPDGLLFRVSSLAGYSRESDAYSLQEDYINSLLKVLSEENKVLLLGEDKT